MAPIDRTSYSAPSRSRYDVVIVGGAMYGSSVSWFLSTNPDFDGSILVIERDPSYEFSSTARTNSCMRQQFSQEINVKVSQFAAEYVKNFRYFMGGDREVPEIALHSYGYLYMAGTKDAVDIMKQCQAIQAACGAGTQFMTRDEIADAYPFYNLEGVLGANHNLKDEGYFDGGTVFNWWRQSGKAHGVEFIANEAVAMTLNASETQVESVILATGEIVACGTVVNASGPRATLTSRMAGIELPIEPRRRYTYIFDAEQPLDRDLPLTIDPSGCHMRSDGRYYLAGCPPDHDPATDYDDFAEDHDIWEAKLWPAIANRVPQFEAIKVINSWVGHYAFNTLDQNAILGRHTRVENFIFVNGFSGHGFQQSPAMGRGTAELITYGEYRSLDLTPFDFSRIERNEPFLELAII
ncbi:MAG: FAD-dependent oxidoreductase [Rhodospirillaceae bacterium]|nr:FAD-dependent oxidoreductase [Rhodospirillaceae bacterium]|tara:strand:+ start:849 stop:2075 length:1227 start_codon:yes stop_codon:yes gene_type:complete